MDTLLHKKEAKMIFVISLILISTLFYFFIQLLQSSTILESPPTSGGSYNKQASIPKWSLYEVSFTGPTHSITDTSPNPFTNYEFYVKFTHLSTGKEYVIPGFFDADGTGGTDGNVWKVRFSPDEIGEWNYAVWFTKGGIPLRPHGETKNFFVNQPSSVAEGFFKEGRLEYVGERYFKFRDGTYFLKGGVDSPENFLAYEGFLHTEHTSSDAIGSIHRYENHVQDWETGDPLFDNGKIGSSYYDSKGIIGALNYLSSQHINSIYFLPMNIGGDAQDTWPYIDVSTPEGAYPGESGNDNLHFDVNKLRQWKEVFEHAQKKGIMLHIVLCENEGENKWELDSATMGFERSVLYRELVARFGYLPAIQWTICEEYDATSDSPVIDLGDLGIHHTMIDAMAAIDPYDHPIAIHNSEYPVCCSSDKLWITDANFLNTNLNTMAIQHIDGIMSWGQDIEDILEYIESNGLDKKVIGFDEPRSTTTTNANDQRKDILWPTYLSGGTIEWYIGGKDQSLENFKAYEDMWQYTFYARSFLEDNFEFWKMKPNDELLKGHISKQLLALEGESYAGYFADVPSSPKIDFPIGVAATYEVTWYDPRTGTYAAPYAITTTGGFTNIGDSPFNDDVAVMVKRM